jgi:hypothetical protein
MAVVIDATAGGTTANSYATLAEADTYFESKAYSSAWDAKTDAEKNTLLVDATRMIDYLFDFNGTITNTSPRQALKWPRTGAYDCESILIDADTIPDNVKYAQFEQALYLTAVEATQTSNIKYEEASVGKGAVKAKFNMYYTAQQLGNAVLDYLRCLGKPVSSVSGGIKNLTLLRS